MRATVKNGKLVYGEGSGEVGSITDCPGAPAVMKVAPLSREALRRKGQGRKDRVMGVKDGSILVEDIEEEARIEDGYLAADHGRDIVFAYVFDRYRAEERYGFGFVNGLP